MRTASTSARRPLTRAVEAASVVARRAIRRDSRLGDRLRRWRHRVVREAPTRPLEQVLDAFARTHPRTSFVQVGSNDGVQLDPLCLQIRTRPWTGVMVEPVPFLFDRLEGNFGSNRRIRLENSAIADHNGSQRFYFLAESTGDERDLPDWYDALGSFRREVVLSHRPHIPDIDDRLRVIDVPCLTFAALCEKHALEHIDLIHIDAEGYDFEVIKLIDFDRWNPEVLLFEHKHLSTEDRTQCLALLTGRGYEVLADDSDSLCILRSTLAADASLATVWSTVSR